MDVLFILFLILFALVLVTVVGHGVWLLCAAIGRALTGAPQQPPRRENSKQPTPRADLPAALRQLAWLVHVGKLSEERQQELVAALYEAHGQPLPDPQPTRAIPETVMAEIVEPPAPVPPHSEKQSPAALSPDSEADVHPLDRAEPTARPAPPDLIIDDDGAPKTGQPTPSPSRQPGRPVTPSRALSDVLQAFMEEKNIRWGEVLSGMLIVGSAVGLVVSLWSKLSQVNYYFPVAIFALATGAIHAAGNYTLRRWNLKSTSRGVLIIATLLIPLNFVAAIALSERSERPLDPATFQYFAAIAAALGAFATMSYFSSQALLKSGWWRLSVAVLGPSLGQLLVYRLASPQTGVWQTGWLFVLPMFSLLVAVITQIVACRRADLFENQHADDTFLLAGISLFSIAPPIVLLVLQTKSLAETMARIAPLLSLVGATVLAAGGLIHNRAEHATRRMWGTALAVLASLAMIGLVWTCWPQPARLVTIGLVNFGILTGLAVMSRLPILHGGAVACLTLAWVVGLQLLQQQFAGHASRLGRRIIELAFTSPTSIAVTVLGLLVGLSGWLLTQRGRKDDGLILQLSAAGLAAASVIMALWGGFVSKLPEAAGSLATGVFAFYTVAVLAVAVRLGRSPVSWAGSVLLLITLVHGLGWNPAIYDRLLPARPLLLAAILHGIVCTVFVLAIWRRVSDRVRRESVIQPLLLSSAITSIVATPVALFAAAGVYLDHAIYCLLIAAIWLGQSIVAIDRPDHSTSDVDSLGNSRRAATDRLLPHQWFAAFQAIATAAVFFACAAFCQHRPWWDNSLVNPRHIVWQFGTLAAWCAAWGGFRIAVWPRRVITDLMQRQEPAVDHIVLAGVVFGQFVTAFIACLPGLAAELGTGHVTTTNWAASDLAGTGAWVALCTSLVAVGLSQADRVQPLVVTAAAGLGATAALLWSASFIEADAVATALRYSLSMLALLAAVYVVQRRRISDVVSRLTRGRTVQLSQTEFDSQALLTLSLSGGGIVAITTIALIRLANGDLVRTPSSDSLFGHIHPAASYVAPLLVLAVALLIVAVNRKRIELVGIASVVFQYAVNVGCLFPVFLAGRSLDDIIVPWLLQTNAIGLGAFALGWILVRPRIVPEGDIGFARGLLDTQVGAAVTLVTLLAVWSAFAIAADPGTAALSVVQTGHWMSYLALALSTTAAVVVWRGNPHAWMSAGACLAVLVSATCGAHTTPVNRVAIHVLTAGWLLMAVLATAASFVGSVFRVDGMIGQQHVVFRRWATVLGLLVVGLVFQDFVVHAEYRDPLRIWFSTAVTMVLAVANVLLAIASVRQRFAWWATVLSMAAVSLLWAAFAGVPGRPQPHTALFFHGNLAMLAINGLFWLAVELLRQSRTSGVEPTDTPPLSPSAGAGRWFSPFVQPGGESVLPDFRGVPIRHAIGIFSLVALAGLTFINFILGALGLKLELAQLAGWSVAMLVGLLLAGSLWDRRARHAIPCLYCFGPVLISMGLAALPLDEYESFCAVIVAGTAWVAVTGSLWRNGVSIAVLGNRLGIANPVEGLERTATWLPVVNQVIASWALVGTFGGVLSFESRPVRMAAGFSPWLSAIGLAAMAQQKRRPRLQLQSLLWAGLGGVCLGWADMPPSWNSEFVLNRAIRLLIVLSALAFLFSVVFSRRIAAENDWSVAVRRAAVTFGGTAVAVLAAVLMLEGALFMQAPGQPIPVDLYQAGAVAFFLAGLVVAQISLALLPGRDPLDLSEKGRMLYVYGAQLVAALLFGHLYAVMPELFSTRLRQYWPYIVMFIAFAGVGTGELFDRRGVRVLAEPLQRTGAFLPLLPAIGFWVMGANTSYSMLMFVIGMLYVFTSIIRPSFASGLAAAVAGNMAVWALLAEQHWTLAGHPQMWLIPPALSVLVAAHLNRERLDSGHLTSLRYASVIVIYLSSTGEMFIRGVGEQLWPPMVLALLSVLGAFTGIVLRIRAFLFVGTSFLMLSIVSMVWHASKALDESWPWWAFCLLLGISILTLFGVFEKKRSEVRALVEHLRRWEK